MAKLKRDFAFSSQLENPPSALVRYADCLLSPFAKGDFGQVAHWELARGGFCSMDSVITLNLSIVSDCQGRIHNQVGSLNRTVSHFNDIQNFGTNIKQVAGFL